MKYNYFEFEKAYFMDQVDLCKKMGLEMLPKIPGEYSQKLIERLKEVEWQWSLPKEEKEVVHTLLQEVKIWLMVHSTYF